MLHRTGSAGQASASMAGCAVAVSLLLLFQPLQSGADSGNPGTIRRLPEISLRINDREVLSEAMALRPAEMQEPDTVILRFIGDVMLHQAQIDNAWDGKGNFDFSGYFDGIRDDLASADVAVANMEFTLAGEPYSGYPAFSAPDSYAEYAAQCGIDVFLTANNHILDKGEKGLVRTLSVYRGLEGKYGTKMTGSAADEEEAGTNYPLFLNVKGLKIALINFTYGTNLTSGKKYPGTNLTVKEDILKALQKAERLGAGLVVALPHWGEEYRTSHSPVQEETAVWLAENGADLIVGTHPHVVQDTCILDTRRGGRVPVIYSLGNAISNMSAANTQTGLLLEVRIPVDAFGEAGEAVPYFTFLWSSLPGRLSDSHTVVKVKDYISRKDEWKQEYEYSKMVSTYIRIKELTGIKD